MVSAQKSNSANWTPTLIGCKNNQKESLPAVASFFTNTNCSWPMTDRSLFELLFSDRERARTWLLAIQRCSSRCWPLEMLRQYIFAPSIN